MAQRIWSSGEPFIFFHTHVVTEETLEKLIREVRAVDMDISVDESRAPYLDHSVAYHRNNNTPPYGSMPLEHALSKLRYTSVPIHLDCKEEDAFTAVLDVAGRLGPRRCILNSFVNELNFLTSSSDDLWGKYVQEDWMPIETLRGAKKRFPDITLTASGRGVTVDLLFADDGKILREIIDTLGKDIDSVNLNIPSDEIVSKEVIGALNNAGILYQVNIDFLKEMPRGVYIGESDDMSKTTTHFFNK